MKLTQLIGMTLICGACTGGSLVNPDQEFVESSSKGGLPSVVAYQWVCESIHRGEDLPPGSAVPAGRKVKKGFESRKAFVALQEGRFYFDFKSAFAEKVKDAKPEVWQKVGDVGMPEFYRYQLVSKAGSEFHVLYLHRQLEEGHFTGNFYGFVKSGDRSGQETFRCKSERWWPISPAGW